MIDLEPIKARLANVATPPPWKAYGPDALGRTFVNREGATLDHAAIIADTGGGNRAARDADLIAHAPTDLAALIAEVERLRGQLAFVACYVSTSASGSERCKVALAHLEEEHDMIGLADAYLAGFPEPASAAVFQSNTGEVIDGPA